MSFLIKIVPSFILSILLTYSCKQETGRSSSDADSNAVVKSEFSSLLINSPENDNFFPVGKEISVGFTFKDTTKLADSVVYRINGKKTAKQTRPYKPFQWNTGNELPGIKNITLTAYYSDSTIESRHVKISLVSDIKPELYTVKVVNTYPHDINAYTEGLFYENGVMYEGTGQTGESTLRKEKLETGENLKVLNLPPDIFGEGIASVDGYVYQLTYKSNIAFMYDKNTFELVRKFNYPMKEGWGLTFDGHNLLMTDGTENIYYMDPEYFTEVKRISVYDDHGPVINLNELEYIKGEIWANVYTTDTIVRIQPSTGKVTGKIIVKDVLSPEDYHPNIEVLNGIAYDKTADRLFITGKNWPKLFEIKLIKK